MGGRTSSPFPVRRNFCFHSNSLPTTRYSFLTREERLCGQPRLKHELESCWSFISLLPFWHLPVGRVHSALSPCPQSIDALRCAGLFNGGTVRLCVSTSGIPYEKACWSMSRNYAILTYNASHICTDNKEMYWPPICFTLELHFPSGSKPKWTIRVAFIRGSSNFNNCIWSGRENASDTIGSEVNDLRHF